METIEVLDSDSDVDDNLDPYSSRASFRKFSSSFIPTENTCYHDDKKDPSPFSDSTITRETQDSTNAAGVRVKGLKGPQVEITILGSDSSININDDTPCIKDLPSKRSDDYFELNSESESSSSPLINPTPQRGKRKGLTIDYLPSDSESSYQSKILNLPSKQKRPNIVAAKSHFQLDSESEESSLKPPEKYIQQQDTNNDHSQDYLKLRSRSSHPLHSTGSKATHDLFDLLDSETGSSYSPLMSNSNHRKATINFNYHSDMDSDSECSSSLKPPAKLIEENCFRNLSSNLGTDPFNLKSNAQSLNELAQQMKGNELKREPFNLEPRTESASSQSIPLNQSIQRPDPDILIILNSSDEDEKHNGYKPSKPDATYPLQKNILSKGVTLSTKSTSKGSQIDKSDAESTLDSDKSLIVLESSTDEDIESEHEDTKPSAKPITYTSDQSSKPGAKKRHRKSNDFIINASSSGYSSDDSLFHLNPFPRAKSCVTKALQTNGPVAARGKTTQETIHLASSPELAKSSKVCSSRDMKSSANLKMAESGDSNSIFTQDSFSVSNGGLKLPHNPYKKMDPVLSAATNSPGDVVKPTSYAKNDVPTPALPSVNEIGGRLYPDLRHQCIKALISHAKVLRRAIHQRGALDASIRAIIVFSLYPYPIRSPEAAANLKGIGSELLEVFKNMLKTCSKEKGKPYCPPRGKFSSVAAATLMALDDYEREKKGNVLCSMEDLITRVNITCHNPTAATHILDRDVEYYLNKDNIDPGWLQIRKLCGGNEPLIKERKKKTACPSGILFELTDQGRAQVQGLRRIASNEPVPPGPLRQLASFFVDKAYGSVTMSMDFREGGGYTKSLHKLCDLLDEYRVPYVVRSLKISDYIYFVGNKLAPILIERKSIDDLAGSLVDGRWESQQRNMRKAQYVLGKAEQRRCQICYIVEGEAGKRVVHGGAIARTSWDVSLEQVENAVASLPQLGFSVMKSKSHMGTMNILSQIARDIWWKYRNGSIDCLMTYDEFIREMARCPDNHGDPPTRPEHMNPVAPVVDAVIGALQESRDSQFNREADPRLEMGLPSSPSSDQSIDDTNDRNKERASELEKLSLAELKELCAERDEKVSGTKKDLIGRLLEERKPEILLTRTRRNQYVPKLPSSNAALLVALHLNHIPGTEGLSKERLMLLAEETGVSKDPMGGKGGWYDGWSGMKEMTTGDPPLVSVVKRKYTLTTQPSGSAGVDVAKALHTMAHRKNICRCGSFKI